MEATETLLTWLHGEDGKALLSLTLCQADGQPASVAVVLRAAGGTAACGEFDPEGLALEFSSALESLRA